MSDNDTNGDLKNAKDHENASRNDDLTDGVENNLDLSMNLNGSESSNATETSDLTETAEWIYGKNCALVCNFRQIAADADEDLDESYGLIYDPNTDNERIKQCEKYVRFHTDVKYRIEPLQKSNKSFLSLS